MKTHGEYQTTIAIIGGGVSGALTAYHLTAQGGAARVVVVDPRPELGLGLAYSTPSLRHLLNVPAGKISALPAQPDHFLNWLRANYDATATESTFAPRAVFGCYVQSLVAGARGIEHVQAAAIEYRPAGERAVVVLDNGCELMADRVVLATGNFDPAPLPGVDAKAVASGSYRHNAWREETYWGLEPDAAMTLIGTGLTAVDVVLRLREMGHRGDDHGGVAAWRVSESACGVYAVGGECDSARNCADVRCVFAGAAGARFARERSGGRRSTACGRRRTIFGWRCRSRSRGASGGICSGGGTWCGIAWRRRLRR